MKAKMLPVFAGLLALVMSSCAQDVGTIDRTQHDKIEKKVFAGVWYYNQTAIDVPYSTGFTFVGETNFGAVNKIVWDIQEKYLVAYPVAEYVVGSEKKWKKHKIRRYWDEDRMDEFIELYVGQPVAAFEIVSHFDVFRKYNPQTGEQTNILEENTVDNKWWKRKYIRVNWAKNSVMDFTFMARVSKQTPVDYYVQTFETENPDAPVISDNYIDVVTKSFVEPESSGSCDLYKVSTGSCVGAVIKFRHSFRKVDPNNDYEPLRYHNEEQMENFGFFLTERYVYDEDYGNIYSGKHSLINRWNIWKQSKDELPLTDENGQPVTKKCFKDLDDTGCDRLKGEFCKAADWFVEGECVKRVSKPYTQREIKPIIYHLSSEVPEFLYDKSYEAVSEWNKALKDTVSWLRFWEEMGYIYGQYQTRSCESNSDCASHAVIDTEVALKFKENIACSNDNPCPSTAHKCENGFCLYVSSNKNVQRDSAKTIIFLGSGSDPKFVEVVDSDYPNKLNNKAAVRFINLNPDVPSADLVVGNGTDIVKDVAYDLNNQTPVYTLIDPVANATFSVKSGGNEIASRGGVTLDKNSVSLFILTKGNKLLRASAFPAEIIGIRLIHASQEDKALQVAVNGGRRDAELLFGENTGYMGVVPKVQKDPQWKDPFLARLTVIFKGDRTDLTCYRFEQHGRCVGWKPELTADDYKRQEEIYNSLPDIFVLCQNIYDGDKEGGYDTRYQKKDAEGNIVYDPCKEFVPGYDKLKKIGDSRYSLIYWIPEAQAASPLGYGPSAADPDTGEIFWATANIYGAPMLTYGQLGKDLVDLINGNLKPDEVSVGKHVRDFLLDKYGSTSSALSPSGESEDLDEMFGKNNLSYAPLLKNVRFDESDFLQMLRIATDKTFLAKLIKAKVPIINPENGKKRLDAVRGTYFEDLMITDEIKQALSGGKLTPGDSYTEEEKVKLSPLNWARWDSVRAERERMRFLGSKNYCFAEFDDEALVGIAKELGCTPEELANGKKCLVGEELFREITRRQYGGVLEHEIGHTLGLRHNFRGSSDLFNFFDEYFMGDGGGTFKGRELEPVPCTYNSECDPGETCTDGFCHGQVETSRSCLADTDCGDENVFLCKELKCHKITTCASNADCGEAGECKEGICYSESGAKIATLDATVETKKVLKMLPRATMTESEKLGKRTEYQYSTIMDYGQRFNSDIHGIGKWDKAAIRFGYGQMIEVYRDITNLRKLMKLYAELYGTSLEYQSDVFDSSYWNYGVFFSQFYFLNNYIGIKENLMRDVVPYELVKLEQSMVPTYDRQLMEYSYVTVPYSFCGDEYAGNVGCYTWDTGVDILEIVNNSWIMLENYYLLDAFKRERFSFGKGGSPYSYFSRILNRWLTPMQDAGMYYALFSHLLKDYGWIDQWRYVRQFGWALREAAEDGFNFLRRIIASPAPGSFKLNSDSNEYYNISYDPGVEGSELDLELGQGKYPYTTFYEEAGMYYYDHPVWIGSFWEKLAAIMTLTDSTVYFTTDFVGEQLEIGVGTSVGFNTIYQKQLSKLLGGVIAGDFSQFSDYVKNGKFTQRDFFPEDTYKGEPIIRPSLDSFSLKLYAALYGLAYLPASIDPSFIDSLAVCLKGNGNCYDLSSSSGVDVEEFDDPFGGKTYLAWNTKYEEDRYSAAFELVKKANDLKVKYLAASGAQKELLKKQLKEVIEVLDMLRGLFELLGNMKI